MKGLKLVATSLTILLVALAGLVFTFSSNSIPVQPTQAAATHANMDMNMDMSGMAMNTEHKPITSVGPAITPASIVSVTIQNFSYSPAIITITKGTTVNWTNLDGARHSATGNGNTFDTGLLGQNENQSVAFNQVGTFDYVCSIHPNMMGKVVVQDAPPIPVTIQNFAFSPATITVTVGTTVTWTNVDNATHTVTSDTSGQFSSGNLTSNQTYSHQFNQAGTFAYHCNIHSSMHGTVVVVAAPQQTNVTIQNFAFSPQVITVTSGTVITWTNRDSATHTVQSDPAGELFDSGDIVTDGVFTHTFGTVGVYRYHCDIHETMTGTVVVYDAPVTPTITSIFPTAVQAGSPAFTLTVNGNNFIQGSTVYWDNTPLTNTIFLTTTALQAQVPASLVSSVATATIRVEDFPGTARSNGLAFTVTAAPTPCQNPYVVTNNLDDGSCNTLRRAVDATRAVTGTQGVTITFAITVPSTITLTQGGLIVPNSVSIQGSCAGGQPAITLDGNGLAADGLTLYGKVSLFGLRIKNFSGRQITIPTVTGGATGGNTFRCIVASRR